MIKKSFISNSFNDTMDFGKSFSSKLDSGDILLLFGDLGSGKTTFVKGLLKGFDFKFEVTSPTFSLVNEYEASKKIIHIDCYREKDINRWINIGIIDYFNSDSIVVIEWPEILEDVIPGYALKLKFTHINNYRRKIKFI
ncbi:MAG: tRNA (adenosine(37)-N6)-threonylcarbamoyltransferase complex ATPase subunit type 1 TsaE [Candidatus Marinimicrobia bacterium]|nr:tRNA (adenosine(37)-N6)-threonylcarbamoyltransferase complex ATPase subunit type 1 TsaE [Candidatus Neomarinimicrobiota bacterium]|tara:strand:+ start:4726 stop:5142 length:417 start_codon:yes stop_codon:yes gene_type:complete